MIAMNNGINGRMTVYMSLYSLNMFVKRFQYKPRFGVRSLTNVAVGNLNQ